MSESRKGEEGRGGEGRGGEGRGGRGGRKKEEVCVSFDPSVPESIRPESRCSSATHEDMIKPDIVGNATPVASPTRPICTNMQRKAKMRDEEIEKAVVAAKELDRVADRPVPSVRAEERSDGRVRTMSLSVESSRAPIPHSVSPSVSPAVPSSRVLSLSGFTALASLKLTCTARGAPTTAARRSSPPKSGPEPQGSPRWPETQM